MISLRPSGQWDERPAASVLGGHFSLRTIEALRKASQVLKVVPV